MEINSFFSLNGKALCPVNTVSQPYVEVIRYLIANASRKFFALGQLSVSTKS